MPAEALTDAATFVLLLSARRNRFLPYPLGHGELFAAMEAAGGGKMSAATWADGLGFEGVKVGLTLAATPERAFGRSGSAAWAGDPGMFWCFLQLSQRARVRQSFPTGDEDEDAQNSQPKVADTAQKQDDHGGRYHGQSEDR